MKIKKLTTNSVVNTVETVAGIAIGAMLSNGISEIIPLENKTAVKAIVAGVGVLGASAISGDDALGKLGKNASLGMAGQQGKEIIVETAQPMLPASTGEGFNKFLHDVFELPAAAPEAVAGGLGLPEYLANAWGPEEPVMSIDQGFATA